MSKSDKQNTAKQSAVPSGRLSRLTRFGTLATTVAGSVVKNGTKQLVMGKRPKLSDLLLTPSNALRVANQLAQLRGAAMKLGQLLSMDSGDFLPPQLSEILAKLRSDARSMPDKQLREVLTREWGSDWATKVKRFDWEPVAAASIGQVHKAVSLNGRELAIKIQYPGVRDSINSDIDNVASILRMTGLIPKEFDLGQLLDEAKKQLHEEADYLREARSIKAYATALSNRDDFLIPDVDDTLTTPSILAMRFIESVPIESMINSPQHIRDSIGQQLFRLLFTELFDMQLMQTDPNFANYRYCTKHQKIVLLDFGATRAFDPNWVEGYRQVIHAAQQNRRDLLKKAALHIGYFDEKTLQKHQELVLDLMELATEPLIHQGPYPFGQTVLSARIRDKGLELAEDRKFWHAPPVDSIFLHRKLGGLFLLASRLKSRVDLEQAL